MSDLMQPAREVLGWIGSSPDAKIPDRVRVRIFDRFGGRCQCGCGRKIAAGEKWEAEDKIAIINGGQRRESNLRPFLVEHHKAKTAEDMKIKSKNYRIRKRHLGVKKPRTIRQWRKFSGEIVTAPRER